MAHANERRDWRIRADFAYALIGTARQLYAHETFGVELAQTAYAFDSTTIDLCLSHLHPYESGDRDEAIFAELGVLNIEGFFLRAPVDAEQPQGLAQTHATTCQKHDGQPDGQVAREILLGFPYALANSRQQPVGLLRGKNERHKGPLGKSRNVLEGVFFTEALSHPELKEATDSREDRVDRPWLSPG